MIKFLSRTILFIISLLTCLIILWGLANKHQKQELNEWYKLAASALVDIGISVPSSLLSKKPEDVVKQKAPITTQAEPNRPTICGRVKSDALDHRYRVYEWQDATGLTQLSDKAPTYGYTNLHIRDLYIDNFFNLSIDSNLAELPAFTQNNIQAGVTKTYKTMSDVIKVAQLRKIDLKLKFISDKKQFHAYRMQVAPDTNNKTTGFYTSRLNQSTIWAVGDREHMTRIALHESSHAIVAAMFGDMPIWLNEGMAGFFEKMVITGEQTYKFSTNDEHFQLLRQSRLPSLLTHFSQSRAQWNSPSNSDLNYAIDWSLFFYMMINSERRQFLRSMLDQMAVNYCQNFDAIQFINHNYKGGLQRLEVGWRQWLKTAPSGIITF